MPTEFENSLEAKRQRLVSAADEILVPARTEERGLTTEEESRFDTIHEEVEALTKQIAQEKRQREAQAMLQEITAPTRVPGISTDRETRSVEQIVWNDEKEFRNWASSGKLSDGSSPESMMENGQHMPVLRNILAPPSVRRQQLEERALTTVTDQGGTEAAGGYLTSESMAAAVELAMKNFNAFRQSPARQLSTPNGEPIQWPMNNDTANMGFRLSQGGNASSNVQDPTFTNKQINAWTYSSGLVGIARQLLQDSRYDVAALLGELLGTRISRIQAFEDTKYSAAVSGGSGPGPDRAAHTDANGPEAVIAYLLGIAGSAGIGHTLDRSDGDALSYESLIDLEMSVDSAYRQLPSTGWMFSSKGLAEVKKLADNQNRPLWLPGNVAGGNPATIYGYPYWVNENMDWIPASGNATVGIVLFGDFSRIVLRDAMDIAVQRLDERYAELFQVGYVGWARHDARVIDAGTRPLKVMASVA